MFRWLSRVIGAAADAAADVVEDVVNAVVEVVSDVVETVGNAIGDAFHWVADRLSDLGAVGRVLGAPFRWVGNVISAAFELVAAAIKGVGALVGGVLGGLIRIAGGILGLNGRVLLQGLGNLASAVVGVVLVVGGKVVALLQTVVPVQGRRRPLTAAEREMLERIYHRGLALYNIRIVEDTAGIFGVTSAPFTFGNTIYLKVPAATAPLDVILTHESVHVWQYQHEGSSYIGGALGAQAFHSDTNANYGWLNEIAAGRLRWLDFNKEAQAWFIEDVYVDGTLTTAGVAQTGSGVFFDADGAGAVGGFVRGADDYTELANATVDVIRGRLDVRLSQLL